MKQRATGFTLIELMIATLVICILLALASRPLRQYLVQAKRAQVQATLLRLMQQQEIYYSQNNRYLAFSSASSEPDEKRFQWWSGERAADSAYEIAGAACPGETIAQCVRLAAMPGTDKVDRRFRDADCGTLWLSSNGRKAASGPAVRCWR